MVDVKVADVWRALDDVRDPEIPVISVVELGVIRDVAAVDGRISVSMTPTFAGCPALDVIRAEIEARLHTLGAVEVDVQIVLSPPWSTDQISEAGRAKLKAFGLAPPPLHGGLIQIIFSDTATCPYCGSAKTALKNNFGSTPCRAIYYCNACRQPFEQFKGL